MSLTKDTARLEYREWQALRDAWQDCKDFDEHDASHMELLAKLDWHCADTFDLPDNDDRPTPAESE